MFSKVLSTLPIPENVNRDREIDSGPGTVQMRTTHSAKPNARDQWPLLNAVPLARRLKKLSKKCSTIK
ncbi:Bgt-20683 [Blumeria graminis f. sp. tritici]|uniref:Bgt-20683 n=2 Tax=Blumeria graminis f. sp. tritici TaxID=62690 RepID=A0A9X9MF48_BLUGR|nr:Bgt-20683 [Blumeria graminis f. sp. tritici]